MSSDFKYNFVFVVEEMFELGQGEAERTNSPISDGLAYGAAQ